MLSTADAGKILGFIEYLHMEYPPDGEPAQIIHGALKKVSTFVRVMADKSAPGEDGRATTAWPTERREKMKELWAERRAAKAESSKIYHWDYNNEKPTQITLADAAALVKKTEAYIKKAINEHGALLSAVPGQGRVTVFTQNSSEQALVHILNEKDVSLSPRPSKKKK
jgi:hypothetical protein